MSIIQSRKGRRPNPCPGILGPEIIGVVDQTGEGVHADVRGDLVRADDRKLQEIEPWRPRTNEF